VLKLDEKIRFLFHNFNEKTLGKIFQLILSFILLRLGFSIIEYKSSGRPDIKVVRNKEKYSIEVKISKTDWIVLKNTDLQGVFIENFTPVIAVFSYNSIESKWLILNAKKIKAGRHYILTLEGNSIKNLEKEINNELPYTLNIYWKDLRNGGKSLLEKLKEEQLLSV
jgi:Holliday junction resolvase